VWAESPAKLAVIVRLREPTASGTYETAHSARPAPEGTIVQLPASKPPSPVPVAKATVPVGAIAGPAAVSETVAVHVVVCPTSTVPGAPPKSETVTTTLIALL
jgi:hypothetical protein